MVKTYIITGANGFLGNNIIRKLEKEKDVDIRALILSNDKVNSLEGLKCQIFEGDVTKKETLEEIFKVDKNREIYVIHCAAIVYIKEKANPFVYDVNVNGVKNIVDKVLQLNAKLIYVSSVHAIPEKPNNELMTEITDFDPNTVKGAYAKTKAKAAQYVLQMVKETNLKACILHPSGIIGPNDFGNSHLTELIKSIANNSIPFIVNGGYNFVDVRDVADGVISACDKGKSGECYILSNQYYSIKEIATIVSKVHHSKLIKIALPIKLVKLVAPLCELYYNIKHQTPLFTKYSLYTLNANANFSNAKAKKELDFTTRDMEETIKDTIFSLKRNKQV